MKNNFDVREFINELGEDLVKIFDRSSKRSIHPDEVGKAKEINIGKQIETILPNGVGVGRGYVFDCYGNISSQCDIILYEKNIIPQFVRDGNDEYSYFPCEGVIAVGEVKSTLSKDELESSLLKLEKIKRMKRKINDIKCYREYLSVLNICGVEEYNPEKKSLNNIFTFIFSKEDVIATETFFKINGRKRKTIHFKLFG